MPTEVLLDKYIGITNLPKHVAEINLDHMISKVRAKYLKLKITDIQNADGNILILLANGISAKFSSPDSIPVWIIPEGKTSRRKSWHKKMAAKDARYF